MGILTRNIHIKHRGATNGALFIMKNLMGSLVATSTHQRLIEPTNIYIYIYVYIMNECWLIIARGSTLSNMNWG